MPRPDGLVLLAALAVLGPLGCAVGGDPEPVRDARTHAASPDVDAALGGTLVVLTDRDRLDSLDPQQVGTDEGQALLSAFLHRTLLTYRGDGDLAPDLATDTGTPNEDFTAWSFTLREDATWEDGTPIRCEDVVRGVSRRVAADGVGDTDLLDGPPVCDGPTVTFRLGEPRADFAEATTRLAFAPVPSAADTGRSGRPHTTAPLASGPYRVAEHDEGRTLVLVRRDGWDPASDPTRPAHPDRVVVEMGLDPDEVVRRVLEEDGDDRFALSTSLPSATAPDALADPRAVGRSWDVPGREVSVLAVSSRLLPGLEQRRAVAAALDTATPAVGVIPPALVPHRSDLDTTGPDPAFETAAELPVLRIVHPRTDVATALVATAAATLRASGVEVTTRPVEVSGYYADVVDPDRAGHLTWLAVRPSWSNASTVVPAVYDADGAFNLSGVNQAGGLAAPQLQDLIDRARATSDREEQAGLWAEADLAAVRLGLVVPLAVERDRRVWGSGLDGVVYDRGYGAYAYRDIAVAP